MLSDVKAKQQYLDSPFSLQYYSTDVQDLLDRRNIGTNLNKFTILTMKFALNVRLNKLQNLVSKNHWKKFRDLKDH